MTELTPEQAAKLARGWVWQSGQMAVATVRPDPASDFTRTGKMRVGVDDGGLTTLVGCWWRTITGATPDLDDPVTADGLPCTARAMWQSPGLSAVCYDGLWLIVTAGRREIHSNSFGEGATETAAWIAAILAAPERA